MTLTDEQIASLRHTFTRRPTGTWSIGDALACVSSLAAQFPDLLDEVESTRALLKKIEWSWDDEVCPYCHGYRANPLFDWRKGHATDCELARLLAGMK